MACGIASKRARRSSGSASWAGDQETKRWDSGGAQRYQRGGSHLLPDSGGKLEGVDVSISADGQDPTIDEELAGELEIAVDGLLIVTAIEVNEAKQGGLEAVVELSRGTGVNVGELVVKAQIVGLDEILVVVVVPVEGVRKEIRAVDRWGFEWIAEVELLGVLAKEAENDGAASLVDADLEQMPGYSMAILSAVDRFEQVTVESLEDACDGVDLGPILFEPLAG